MPIEDWAPTLTAKLAAIQGLAANGTQPHRVRDYRDLPAKLLELPTLIWLPQSARHQYSAGGPAVWVHTIQATLFLSASVLPEALSQAVPYIKLVRDALAANVQLGGLSWSGGRVAHLLPLSEANFYEGPGRVTWGRSEEQEQEFTGLIFRLELKEVETGVTVTP